MDVWLIIGKQFSMFTHLYPFTMYFCSNANENNNRNLKNNEEEFNYPLFSVFST